MGMAMDEMETRGEAYAALPRPQQRLVQNETLPDWAPLKHDATPESGPETRNAKVTARPVCTLAASARGQPVLFRAALCAALSSAP